MAKHPKDPISVKMWVLENPYSIFYYVQHAPLDLNLSNQDDTPFILGIQTPWQFEMMEKFGDHSLISFDATFRMNQSRVCLSLPLNVLFHWMKCSDKIIVYECKT